MTNHQLWINSGLLACSLSQPLPQCLQVLRSCFVLERVWGCGASPPASAAFARPAVSGGFQRALLILNLGQQGIEFLLRVLVRQLGLVVQALEQLGDLGLSFWSEVDGQWFAGKDVQLVDQRR